MRGEKGSRGIWFCRGGIAQRFRHHAGFAEEDSFEKKKIMISLLLLVKKKNSIDPLNQDVDRHYRLSFANCDRTSLR